MSTVIVGICFLTAVKFVLLASWLRGRPSEHAVTLDLVAAGLCVAVGTAFALGSSVLVPVAGLAAAVALGLVSIRLARVERRTSRH